jgi:hypothetical protein
MSLTQPLGLLIAGPVAERFGVAFYFVLAGGMSFVISVVCVFTVRKNSA